MTSFEQFLQQALAASNIASDTLTESDDEERKHHNDPQTICMNAPFLMRVLELVHEDVENDKQLHIIVEAIQDQMKDLDEDQVLTMDNYDAIEQALEVEEDEEKSEDEEESEDEKSEDEESDDDDEEESEEQQKQDEPAEPQHEAE